MSEWISAEEVGELTALAPNSWKAQCRRLAAMGIAFTVNGAGRPLVERAVAYPAATRAARGKPAHAGPKWEKVRGKAA